MLHKHGMLVTSDQTSSSNNYQHLHISFHLQSSNAWIQPTYFAHLQDELRAEDHTGVILISETGCRLDKCDGRIYLHKRLAACISKLPEEYALFVPWTTECIASARAPYSVLVPAVLPN
jgi:hypothetical protein